MNKYECIFIFSGAAMQPDSTKAIESVKGVIQKANGQIESVEEWGRRRLAYLIKKQDEGYYVIVNFTMSPEGIDVIQSAYRLMGDILKFLVIKKDPKFEALLEASKKRARKDESEEGSQESEINDSVEVGS